MKKRYIIGFALLFMFNVCKVDNYKCVNVSNEKKYEYRLVDDISYDENIEEINTNPERGFYRTAFLNMKESGSVATTSGANLVHLRVNIGSFSRVNNGVVDKVISDDALRALDKTLKNIKEKGGSIIIRFAYDGFNGNANVEPSLDMILKHIEQLGQVISDNSDVVSYVECGLFGPWGEMHTSSISSTSNVSKAIDKWLEVTPDDMKIGVRTPNYYVAWANIERSNIDKNITSKGTKFYRVGLYNDGYLGSESDLGTFLNRDKEIKWLESQATHTFYGGEVVANFASGSPLNTPEYIEQEAFKTHTTYLNIEWNNNVINNWKNQIFNGNDSLYKGKSGYLYVNNHLGYRYVLKESLVDDEIHENGNIKIKLLVDNVGFGNMINEKKVTLVLINDDKVYEIDTDIDVRDWLSKNNTVEINTLVPEEISVGEWKAYLRISQKGDLENDNNYMTVKFANDDIWNEEIGANYIGVVKVLEKKIEEEKEENEDQEETYTLNYYLDNKLMDGFSRDVKGDINLIKDENVKDIEDYKFIKVVVDGKNINYYYESKVKNPNTADKFMISMVIMITLFVITIGLKKIKVKRYV